MVNSNVTNTFHPSGETSCCRLPFELAMTELSRALHLALGLQCLDTVKKLQLALRELGATFLHTSCRCVRLTCDTIATEHHGARLTFLARCD
jgi:hypothetical protein